MLFVHNTKQLSQLKAKYTMLINICCCLELTAYQLLKHTRTKHYNTRKQTSIM